MIGGRKSRAQVAAVAAAFLGLIQVSLSAGASGVSSEDPGASQATARSAEGFWTQDVWADPSRPFLFYGEKREHEVKSPTEKKAVERKDRSKAGGEVKKSDAHVSDDQLAIFPADGLDRAAAGESLTREGEAAGLEKASGASRRLRSCGRRWTAGWMRRDESDSCRNRSLSAGQCLFDAKGRRLCRELETSLGRQPAV